MLVRFDLMSGRNRRWEWLPNTADAEDGRTMLEASRHAGCDSQERLIFANVAEALS